MEFLAKKEWDAWDPVLKRGKVTRCGKFKNAHGTAVQIGNTKTRVKS
jgi:hypothetical protein